MHPSPKLKPFDLDDTILNYDPETPDARFAVMGFEAATAAFSERLPRPCPGPHSPPTIMPIDPAPAEDAPLAKGYDAIVMTWTAAEAAALAALFTPNHLPSTWYEYRHNVASYIPLVTGARAPFNDKTASMTRYYHSLGLYMPCRIGSKKVLLFKSGLHLDYDGPQTPLKKLVTELVDAVEPKVLITTGTAGGIGKDTTLGDVVIGNRVQFDCTTQFKTEPWATAEYSSSPLPAGALKAITPSLLDVNAAFLPNKPKPKIWHGPTVRIVTTDFFGFDDSTNHYKLEGKGQACEMGDAMVLQALEARPKASCHAIRNASDPQIDNPTGDMTTANHTAGQIYTKYGAYTTAGSVIATWAVLATL
jgi:nucleoside phosphorylase